MDRVGWSGPDHAIAASRLLAAGLASHRAVALARKNIDVCFAFGQLEAEGSVVVGGRRGTRFPDGERGVGDGYDVLVDQDASEAWLSFGGILALTWRG